MNPPGSPPSGELVGPSALPTKTDAGGTAETGITSTSQSVSHHPAKKRIPENDAPVSNSGGLPDDVQPASANRSTVSPSSPGGGAEGIKRDLDLLLAVDQPLEQSFRKNEEMKYIDATKTALEKIREEMNGKWDRSNNNLKKAFKKAHKAAIKKLKEDKTSDVKVTFNLPDGKRVRLIPPELDDLDLSNLKSWLQGSLELVNELKSEKQSAYDAGLIEQAITDGDREFNTLLSQLAQLGSSRQEVLGFQARYYAIQNPIISLSFDGSSQKSSERPESRSTPEAVDPGPSIKITNDPEKALVVSESGNTAFREESLPSDADHEKRVERARKAYNDLVYKMIAKEASEEMLDAKAMLMEELEQRLQGKLEIDPDDTSGLSPAQEEMEAMPPSEDNTTPERSGDDALRAGSQPPPPPLPGSF